MKLAALIAIPTVALSALALAHGGATGIVKERMDQMVAISKAMKTMAKMVKGEIAYDAVKVRTLSREVSQMGGATLTNLFPRHSMDPPTEARMEIWQDWGRFEQLAFDMQRTGLALSDGAENSDGRGDAGSPFTLFGELAGTCKACHDDFRIKK